MKKPNFLDFMLIAIMLVSGLGFVLAKAGHAGVDQVIEGVRKVKLKISIIGLKTLDTEIIKKGDHSSITIRNRPIEPAMEVVEVEHWPHKASFLSPDGKSVVAFPDPAIPFANDFLVTVTDEAEVTKDGYVIRGNKVKIGNQIELEGMKYRVQGMVVDIL
jgi:hypothetical protein